MTFRTKTPKEYTICLDSSGKKKKRAKSEWLLVYAWVNLTTYPH